MDKSTGRQNLLGDVRHAKAVDLTYRHEFFLGALVWTVDNEILHAHCCIKSLIQFAWFDTTTSRCKHRARKARHLFAARKQRRCAELSEFGSYGKSVREESK